jgi:hypothetical protein
MKIYSNCNLNEMANWQQQVWMSQKESLIKNESIFTKKKEASGSLKTIVLLIHGLESAIE